MSKKLDKIKVALTEAQDALSQMAEEAQDYYDSRSERWQESDKASEWEDKISNLEGAAESVQDAIDYLSEIE